MRKAVAIAATVALHSVALSASSDATMVFISGACSLSINAEAKPCKSVIYTHVQATRRASFNVPADVGAISFSGRNHLRPKPGYYILTVDSILNGPAADSRRTPAEGRCEMRMSNNGDYVHSVSCTAQTQFGPARLTLKGDGTKISGMHGPPP